MSAATRSLAGAGRSGAEEIPTSGTPWELLLRLSVWWVFPALLIGATLNQQLDRPLLLGLGQMISWLALLAAAVIALATFRARIFLLLLFAGLVFARAGRIALGEESIFLALYTVFLGGIFAMAGAGMILRYPRILYRQVLVFSAISVVVMFLQLVGVGEWTQVLRTDFHGGLLDKRQYPTLFVSADEGFFTVFQARPAGLLFANNFLSLILMFAIGLHYGLVRRAAVSHWDVVLCAMVVLAMAKITFLTLAVVLLWMVTMGGPERRRRAVGVVVTFAALLFVYAKLFPGVFLYNLSFENAYLNFLVRRADLLASIRGEVLTEVALQTLSGEEMMYDLGSGDTRQSGYATVARALPFLAAAALLLAPFHAYGRRLLRRSFPEVYTTSTTLLLVLLLMPLITSFLEGPVFWFIGGASFIPLMLMIWKFPIRRRRAAGGVA